MADIKVGDKVSYNGGIIGTVTVYNVQADRFTIETTVGGGVNTIHGHVSNTDLALIEAAPVVEPAATVKKAGNDE